MKDERELETYEITRFVDDVSPTHYEKPGIQKPSDWTMEASESRVHEIKNILQRPVEIADGLFDSSFAGVTYTFPEDLINASANLKAKLDYFEFFRADIHVKIVFNATPFQQGKYWVFFSPYDSVSGRGNTGTIQNATGYPGVEIDIANGSPVELKIPYCAPLSHYRLTNGEGQMGELKIVEITNLASGTAGDSAAFTVFAWFENIELTMPTRLQAQMDESEQQTEKSSIRALTDNIGAAAIAVTDAIPPLRVLTEPLGWVTRAVSGALSAFGYNKPTSEHANCPYTNLPGKGYTAMDGLDLSSKLAAAPDNSLVTKEGIFSSSMDEMDLDFVKAKSCVVSRLNNWDTTQAKGTIIKRWINSPGAVETYTIDEPFDPTTLNYLASMFKYWRGGMKYRISVVKTAFHTGRLRISYVPASSGTIPPNPDNLEFCHNWILDLSQSSELEFTVPYVNNIPWCQVEMQGNNNLVSQGVIPASTGYLVIEVLTPLRAASTSVAQSVNIVIWHSGGKDFELAVPEFSRAYVSDGNLPFASEELEEEDFPRLEAQIFNETEAAIAHKEQEVDSSVSFFGAPSKGFTLPEELTIGEKITSLRQLIKRFGESVRGAKFPYRSAGVVAPPGPVNPNSVATGVPNMAQHTFLCDPVFLGNKTNDNKGTTVTYSLPTGFDAAGEPTATASFQTQTRNLSSVPLHYISYLYRFWRGSRRYKIFTDASSHYTGFAQRVGTGTGSGVRSDEVRPQVPWVVKRRGDISAGAIGPTPTTLNPGLLVGEFSDFEHTVYPDLNGCVEFEVPYYSALPISVCVDGTGGNPVDLTVGPMFARKLVSASLGYNADSLDVPAVAFGSDVAPESNLVYRNAIGSARVLEAAGDDFSFGYLVGAPKIVYTSPLA
jgi:hypothetical protein